MNPDEPMDERYICTADDCGEHFVVAYREAVKCPACGGIAVVRAPDDDYLLEESR